MIEEFWRFARMTRIAHHIPGRVRLKLVGPLEASTTRTRHVLDAASGLAGIRSVKVNPLARSCVVEYDPALIEPSAWQDLVEGTASPPVQRLLQALCRD